MSKRALIACIALACACVFAMTACSNASTSSAASSASVESSSTESSSSSGPADQFIGQWQLAGAEIQGLVVSGAFNRLVETEAVSITAILKDGTAKAQIHGNDATATWTVANDGITIVVIADDSATAASSSSEAASGSSASASAESASASSGSDSASSTSSSARSKPAETITLKGTVEDGVMKLVNSADNSYTMLFTKDGTLENAPQIDEANAQPVTDESALLGTWNLACLKLMDMSMYGKVEDLSSVSGVDITSLAFEKGGRVTFGDHEATFTVGPEGANLVQGATITPIMSLGDDIVLDISKEVGMQLVLVFSKQDATSK